MTPAAATSRYRRGAGRAGPIWFDLLRGERFGVLLAEQNARFALNHADRGYILEKGRISYAGAAAELHGSEALLSGLGVSARPARRDVAGSGARPEDAE